MYCAIGGCDVTDKHPEVVKTADDYLWLRLCQVRDVGDEGQSGDLSPANTDRLSYALLQSLISEEYGSYVCWLLVWLVPNIRPVRKDFEFGHCISGISFILPLDLQARRISTLQSNLMCTSKCYSWPVSLRLELKYCTGVPNSPRILFILPSPLMSRVFSHYLITFPDQFVRSEKKISRHFIENSSADLNSLYCSIVCV